MQVCLHKIGARLLGKLKLLSCQFLNNAVGALTSCKKRLRCVSVYHNNLSKCTDKTMHLIFLIKKQTQYYDSNGIRIVMSDIFIWKGDKNSGPPECMRTWGLVLTIFSGLKGKTNQDFTHSNCQHSLKFKVRKSQNEIILVSILPKNNQK